MATTADIPEIEELIEAFLVSRLSSACTIPVVGFLAPSSVGTEKRLDSDTFIEVKVDQSSQDGDYKGRAPFSYAATVTVRYARADDATGTDFRDECRRVKASLMGLIGDGCAAFDSDSFNCNEFLLGATNSNFDDGENPTDTKAYTATLIGRNLQTITTTETEAE